MSRTRVKICGLTRPADVQAAVAAGADALGFVFYAPSPRAVSTGLAAELVATVPAFVTTVGLFVNPEPADVRDVLARVPLDLLQFHGDEPADFCASFGRPWIKALRMRDDIDLAAEASRYAAARGLLLDTYVAGTPGGTGQSFDWSRIPAQLSLPVILAGGLDVENVASAVARARPWAVDVSGGVEEVNVEGKRLAGLKSATAIEAFIRGVESV